MAVSSRMGGRRGVCRTAATSAGCGVWSRVDGCCCCCESGVRAGVYGGETIRGCDCGRVGLGATSGMGRWTTSVSGVGACGGASASAAAAGAAGVSGGTTRTGSATGAGEGADVEESVDVGSLEAPLLVSASAGGSGRCSEFGMLQRGQTQSRELHV